MRMLFGGGLVLAIYWILRNNFDFRIQSKHGLVVRLEGLPSIRHAEVRHFFEHEFNGYAYLEVRGRIINAVGLFFSLQKKCKLKVAVFIAVDIYISKEALSTPKNLDLTSIFNAWLITFSASGSRSEQATE